MSVDQRNRNQGGWSLTNVPYIWFLLPGLLAYTVLFIYPTVRSFYLSLYDWSGRGPLGPIVWEQNFRDIVHSDKFWQAAGNSFRLFIFIFIFQNTVSLGLALLLNRPGPATHFFRVIIFLPQIMSAVATGIVWIMMLDPIIGAVNPFLANIGLGDKSKVFGMMAGNPDTNEYITNPYRVDVQYRGTGGFPPNSITYRVLYGDEKLAHKLRQWLLSLTGGNPAFLKSLATNALDVAPPLGKIRDFVVDDDPKYPGTIDLKKFGARLFVDAARVLALRTGVDATATVQRLRQGGSRIGMPAEELAAMADGFHFIQLLRLRHQHLDTDHGAPGDNRVKPDDLNELDRRILKEAFRQARKIQLRLKLDYQI